jgi:uridylate kinase
MRILLKLSGEQLSSDGQASFDVERAQWITGEIKKARAAGAEIVVIVGGGNVIRGKDFANSELVRRVSADYMGMLSGVINTLGLAEVFNNSDLPTAALSNIKADQVIDQYTYRRALSHLTKGRVVLVAGGMARPFFSHDTVAVNVALELDCDLVLKATKVDGVFDDDPEKNPDAKKIPAMSLSEAVENSKIKVMDKAALGLAAEFGKPIVVFELLKEGNIARIARGETVGTRIS